MSFKQVLGVICLFAILLPTYQHRRQRVQEHFIELKIEKPYCLIGRTNKFNEFGLWAKKGSKVKFVKMEMKCRDGCKITGKQVDDITRIGLIETMKWYLVMDFQCYNRDTPQRICIDLGTSQWMTHFKSRLFLTSLDTPYLPNVVQDILFQNGTKKEERAATVTQNCTHRLHGFHNGAKLGPHLMEDEDPAELEREESEFNVNNYK